MCQLNWTLIKVTIQKIQCKSSTKLIFRLGSPISSPICLVFLKITVCLRRLNKKKVLTKRDKKKKLQFMQIEPLLPGKNVCVSSDNYPESILPKMQKCFKQAANCQMATVSNQPSANLKWQKIPWKKTLSLSSTPNATSLLLCSTLKLANKLILHRLASVTLQIYSFLFL